LLLAQSSRRTGSLWLASATTGAATKNKRPGALTAATAYPQDRP